MSLLGYVIKRILVGIPLVLLIAILNFVIVHSAPGDPVSYMISGVDLASPGFVQQKRHQLGLDQPLYIQLLIYLNNLFHGDLGFSFIFHRPVVDVIGERLVATLMLTLTAFMIAVVCGVFLGVYASKRPYSAGDTSFTLFGLALWSMPTFWIGMLAIIIFSVDLKMFPIFGFQDIGLTGLASVINIGWHLILPAAALGLGMFAMYTRLVRANMLEILKQDYITTAWAKGCDERDVFYKHALRNALLPLITMMGFQVSFLFTGALLIETVFAWPGIGRLLYDSIVRRDYLIVQSVFLVVSILTIAANLLADIVYAFLDPRIRFK
jgi:peptide/nickel transport system permease protein